MTRRRSDVYKKTKRAESACFFLNLPLYFSQMEQWSGFEHGATWMTDSPLWTLWRCILTLRKVLPPQVASFRQWKRCFLLVVFFDFIFVLVFNDKLWTAVFLTWGALTFLAWNGTCCSFQIKFYFFKKVAKGWSFGEKTIGWEDLVSDWRLSIHGSCPMVTYSQKSILTPSF